MPAHYLQQNISWSLYLFNYNNSHKHGVKKRKPQLFLYTPRINTATLAVNDNCLAQYPVLT